MNIIEVKKILDCVIMDQCSDGSFNDQLIIKNLLSQRISVGKVENPCTGLRALNSKRILKFERLIISIAEYCDELDIQYYFPKAFQHYPDMGNDIDLFININANERKEFIKHFELASDETSFLNIISGKNAYSYKDQIPLETHQYAGHFGEFKALTQEFYGSLILENGVYQLSDEFKFINQIIQRFFGHFTIRLSDIIYSINLLNKGIDLEFVRKKSLEHGLEVALDQYLVFIFQNFSSYVSRHYQSINLHGERLTKVVISGEHFIIPKRFAIRLYCYKFLSDLAHLRIYSVIKMFGAPVMGAVLIFRKLFRA